MTDTTTENDALARLLGWTERTIPKSTPLPDYFNDANTRGELLEAVKRLDVGKILLWQAMGCPSGDTKAGQYVTDTVWLGLECTQPQLARAALAVLRDAEGGE
ncbi:MAG: hypothetical protein ACR2NF_05220 [Pirellulales bacterium]